jgi:hypothetical protein
VRPDKQIICIKWGTAYPARYVNVLYAMCARNITGAFKLHCFTDDAAGIRPEIACHALPELGCQIPPDSPGKWRKQALWARELPGGVTGTVLFLDLDSAIVGNMDDYFTYGSSDDVITARNWARPLRRLGQTSVFRFKVGAHAYMLDNLRADPAGIAHKYQFEQHYVTHGIRNGIKFWPETWTKHFRLHCLPPLPLRYFLPPQLPRDCKIVTFPGGPNPEQIVKGHWWHDETTHTPWQHIRSAFREYGHAMHDGSRIGLMKDLKSYLRTPEWLVKHWQE